MHPIPSATSWVSTRWMEPDLAVTITELVCDVEVTAGERGVALALGVEVVVLMRDETDDAEAPSQPFCLNQSH